MYFIFCFCCLFGEFFCGFFEIGCYGFRICLMSFLILFIFCIGYMGYCLFFKFVDLDKFMSGEDFKFGMDVKFREVGEVKDRWEVNGNVIVVLS